MHAVLRLTLGSIIPNVQASWVKLGREGALQMLSCGANDLGGALINESITRAAGAAHGQVWTPNEMRGAILANGRVAQQRSTLYQPLEAALQRPVLEDTLRWISNAPAGRRAAAKRLESPA